MRARYKSPSGTGTIELADDVTLEGLLIELKIRTGVESFTVKYGPPMAMKTLDLSRRMETARSLGLHGETLTIVPDEMRAVTPPAAAPQNDNAQISQTALQDNPEDINIPWPERDGTLCESGEIHKERLY